MDARKLVGMTEGAKKRAALYESLHTQDTGPDKLTNREARVVWASVCNMVAHSRPWREQVRKSYRIGQKLRPCKGCAQCLKCSCGNVAACIGLYEPWNKHQQAAPACDECCGHGCEDGHCYKLDNFFPCDGSGVVSAKPKKVRR